MIYRSFASAPELTGNFKHTVCRPMAHSMGHDVLSDFADRPADDPIFGLYKNCGFATHDEAAILWSCALRTNPELQWLEIGSHTGWSTSHIAAAVRRVLAVDNMLPVYEFEKRFMENTEPFRCRITPMAMRADEFFDREFPPNFKIGGAFIDGDHDKPHPFLDALESAKLAGPDACIIFHDSWGGPVRQGVLALMDDGWKCRWYNTPHGLACCFRGAFVPPAHVPDPAINWTLVRECHAAGFPFGRCV